MRLSRLPRSDLGQATGPDPQEAGWEGLGHIQRDRHGNDRIEVVGAGSNDEGVALPLDRATA